jgi:Beta-propeller repeat
MTIRFEKWMLCLFVSIAAAGMAPAFAGGDMDASEADAILGAAESTFGNPFATLPLAFEQNLGQSHPRVRFVARGAAFDAFLTDEGANLVVGQSVVQIRPVRAHKSAIPKASDPLAGTTNYLLGDDPSRYVVDAKTFARVKYESVYPGIDLVFYGTQRELEYDLVVAPKANPRVIALELQGVDRLTLLPEGAVALHTPSGDIEFKKPVAYQNIHGTRLDVDVRYTLLEKKRIGFRLGKYDVEYPLVIDPILSISTNLWGTSTGVALDSANNIYVVGSTSKGDLLPVAGGYQTQIAGDVDAYVAKLNPAGTAAIYTTYLGARRATTVGKKIAVDGAGSALVTGTTSSAAFPITPGAFQSTGTNFVTKLNPAGNGLGYSTYVSSPVAAIAVDAAGNAFMTGTSAGLTTTAGAFQPTKLGSTAPYVAKLNASGTAMSYATYLGGSANDEGRAIAVDSSGNAYVVGIARSSDFPTKNPIRASLSGSTDAFIAKINAPGTALVYSTYLGGSGEERGFGVAVDSADQAIAVGWTQSVDFPVTPGAFQTRKGYQDQIIINAFVTKLNSTGSGLVYSSYLGGPWCFSPTVYSCFSFFGVDEGIDVATSVAVDAAGYAYVGGYATSTQFPLVDSLESVDPMGDGWHVPLVAKVAPGGDRVIFATVLGTKSQDAGLSQIAADSNGGAVAVGSTPYEPLFPLTPGAVLGKGSSYMFKVATGIYPTTVQSSPNPVGAAQPVTLTAYVSNPSPAGVVTFKEGTSTVGTAPVINGAAVLSVTLPPGVHRLTATNSADGKVSAAYFQIVNGQ